MPEDDVLLSDFEQWHFVLSGDYLALDEAEWDGFYAELEAAGHSSHSPFPEAFRARAEATWPRVFDPKRIGWDLAWCGNPDNQGIQATFWRCMLTG